MKRKFPSRSPTMSSTIKRAVRMAGFNTVATYNDLYQSGTRRLHYYGQLNWRVSLDSFKRSLVARLSRAAIPYESIIVGRFDIYIYFTKGHYQKAKP